MKAAACLIEGLRAAAAPGMRASCVASFLGNTLKLLGPRGDRVLSNLARVYPESTDSWRREVRSKLYEHLGWMLTEIFVLQRDPKQALSWVEDVEGFEYVEEALSEKKGLLILSGHYGNWELFAAWYAQFLKPRGIDFYIVSQSTKDKDIARLIEKYRRNAGIALLPKQTSTLEMVKLLKSGKQVAALSDISWIDGVRLPFMGQICTNTTGPAVLSMLSGVNIVPAALYRKGPFRHKAKFLPPLAVPQEKDRKLRIELVTRNVNEALERLISEQPELWFWLHNRWK